MSAQPTFGELMETLDAACAGQGTLDVVGFNGPMYINAVTVRKFLSEVRIAATMGTPLSAGESIALSLCMQKAGL